MKNRQEMLQEIKEWYAKETNKTVLDFDNYDNHICKVVFEYNNKVKEPNKIYCTCDFPLIRNGYCGNCELDLKD